MLAPSGILAARLIAEAHEASGLSKAQFAAWLRRVAKDLETP